jgi:hypothetical protein
MMVCADRLRAVPGPRKSTRMNKLHRLGPRFAWAVAGHLRLVNRAAKSKALDAEEFVDDFFKDHSPEPSAELFRAFDSFLQAEVADDLRKYFDNSPPLEALNIEVVFFWIDDAGLSHMHSAKLWHSPTVTASDTAAPAIDDTTTVSIIVGGTGLEVLQTLVASDEHLETFRGDKALGDLVRGTTRVEDLNLRIARGLLKRLIISASRAERRIRSDQTMSEESDCLTLPYRSPSVRHPR